jgi:rhodanese-related sulfurtransferase
VRLAIAFVFAVAGAQPAAAQPKKPPPKPSQSIAPAKINVADAKKLFANRSATFVDTRSNAEYVKGHIKGAINLPTADIVQRAKEIPPGKMIVLYGTDPEVAGADLIRHGIRNAVVLQGGLAAWKLGGNPVTTGPR